MVRKLQALLTLPLITGAWGKIKHVVLFGDSFTDQSRQYSINIGMRPGKYYQELFPPSIDAADGGYQWPWYLGRYGNFTIWNYAVGGAACSHELTPVNEYPDVVVGQTAWFIQDHVSVNGTDLKLKLDPSELVVDIFVGTNDVGTASFVTDSQPPNVSLVDLAACQMRSIRNLHALGARQFILNSLAPLHLAGLYSISLEDNGDAWHKRVYNLVNSLNALLKYGVAELNHEWQRDGKGGNVEFFDTYALFEDMYTEPQRWFNGSITPDVVGLWRDCQNCTLADKDSYMWWDNIHPSEQTGRNLAREILKKIKGTSRY